MKLFEVPMVVTCLVGLGFLAGLDVPTAHADFTFGEPVNIQSDFPFFNLATDYSIDSFSADGLEMYVGSNRTGGQGGSDLWVCKRASPQDDWGPPENLGSVVNSTSNEYLSAITGDGLELYFYSDRSGGSSSFNIYVTKRATRDSPWSPATNLGPNVNSSSFAYDPAVSSDGLELYFIHWNAPEGYGQGDLYVSKRATTQDSWGPAENLGPAENSPANERYPCVSPDGLLLFFNSNRSAAYRVWMTRRANRSAPWEPAVNLGPTINGPLNNYVPRLAPDGSALYFGRGPGNTVTSYLKAPILPVVDFNSDGAVDLADLVLLIENWGTDNTLYDIGPFAWGDGVVDIEDLKAFVAEWEEQNPPAQP